MAVVLPQRFANPDPALYTEEALEIGRVMFARECLFRLGVAGLEQLPEEGMPEIAFAGRSNVGKSSLLNALTGRTNLARTSGDPGRTRELNFFDLSGQCFLVDLPGYGYARAADTAVKAWTSLMKDYLRGRRSLARVVLLIDSRHGLKKNDLEVMDALENSAVVYLVTLTKLDKLNPREADAVINDTKAMLTKRVGAFPRLVAVSSHSGLGIDILRAELANVAGLISLGA